MKVRDILLSKNRTPFTLARDTLPSPCVIHLADADLGSPLRQARALPPAAWRMA